MFVALRHRDFRLLWAGLLLFFTGTFMQSAAVLWHVSLLVPDNRRALALGFVGLARIGPILLFSMISGVAADALNRRTLMLVTQSITAILAALTLRGLDVVWPIYALAACSSAAGAAGAGEVQGSGLKAQGSRLTVADRPAVEHPRVVMRPEP